MLRRLSLGGKKKEKPKSPTDNTTNQVPLCYTTDDIDRELELLYLPENILQQILCLLTHIDVINFSLVSRQCRTLGESNKVWKTLVIRDWTLPNPRTKDWKKYYEKRHLAKTTRIRETEPVVNKRNTVLLTTNTFNDTFMSNNNPQRKSINMSANHASYVQSFDRNIIISNDIDNNNNNNRLNPLLSSNNDFDDIIDNNQYIDQYDGNGNMHSSTNSPLVSKPSSNSLNRNGLQNSNYGNSMNNHNDSNQGNNNNNTSSNVIGPPALTAGSNNIVGMSNGLQVNTPSGVALFKQMDYLIYGKYKLLDKLGSGSFGEIYSGICVTDGEKIAIKLESLRTRHPQLHYESRVYKIIKGGVGIPNARWFGVEGDYSIMVMDILGSSLKIYSHIVIGNSLSKLFSW